MPSWFETVAGKELGQGDILPSCPVPLLPANYPPDAASATLDNPLQIEGNLELRDVVVLSQSCDLINRKVSSVIVGPLWPLDRLPELTNDDKLKTEVNRMKSLCDFIRDGNSPRFHLLNQCEIEGHTRDFAVVDFWAVFTVPFNYLESFAEYKGQRVRLQSPYTEHLSQAFARFVMRVGLPSPIPSFKK